MFQQLGAFGQVGGGAGGVAGAGQGWGRGGMKRKWTAFRIQIRKH